MDATATQLRIGAWSVDPATNQIARDGEVVRLEARTMRLLLCLAERAGQTVSTDELMDKVWSRTVVTQDSVYQAVASLRRILGDDPKQPAYIVTVPRRGYRLVAKVGADESAAAEFPPPAAPDVSRTRRWIGLALGLAALAALILGVVWWNVRAPDARSVAVLPFLDLTSEAMNEEYFADGMTEELIGRLSKVGNLRVPPPTASFYFKNKQQSLREIARSLNVAYVVDGSVRRSGTTLRIAARLVRADDGFIVWSQAYDRDARDLLQAQDDIANEVVKALAGSQLLKTR